jgi:hypothetical protein
MLVTTQVLICHWSCSKKKKDLKTLAPEKVSEELQMRDAKAGRF